MGRLLLLVQTEFEPVVEDQANRREDPLPTRLHVFREPGEHLLPGVLGGLGDIA